jgi:hypothetical protein
MTDKLFPKGDYTFSEHANATRDTRGKVHYPALIRLELTEAGAWLILGELMQALKHGAFEDGRAVRQITLVGDIQRCNEDGRPINMDGTVSND